MKINLLVLRCRELEASKRFYERLGFEFVEEKHGDGPLHYASEEAGFVFELYPLAENEQAGHSRIGFSIKDLQQVRSQVAIASQYEVDGKQVYVIQDPDGRKVELKQQ